VRKSPLPPDQTWTEVPFYTYFVEQDTKKFCKAMREDRPVDIDAIESYPVISFVNTNTYISPDETVFIDWEGNYFIAKEDGIELPTPRNIIYTESTIVDYNDKIRFRQHYHNTGKQTPINYEAAI
jgi:hypothetical protein